jgi:hypothetical protein
VEKKLLYFIALFIVFTSVTYVLIKSPEKEKTLYTDYNTSTAFWTENASSLVESLDIGEATYLGKDVVTKGKWPGVYGSYAYIIPSPPSERTGIPIGNFTVPEENDYYEYGWSAEHVAGLSFNKTEPPYWDEYHTSIPRINYTLTGTMIEGPEEETIQLPAFVWAWEKGFQNPHKDDRALYFPHEEGFRLTTWFDGSERGFPLYGYFKITLSFPEGSYLLSLYGYDMERTQRSNQTVTLTINGKVSDSKVIKEKDFDEGVYILYLVKGPAEAVVKIGKEADSVNTVLSGVFIDGI